jgi:hypothetical protein
MSNILVSYIAVKKSYTQQGAGAASPAAAWPSPAYGGTQGLLGVSQGLQGGAASPLAVGPQGLLGGLQGLQGGASPLAVCASPEQIAALQQVCVRDGESE